MPGENSKLQTLYCFLLVLSCGSCKTRAHIVNQIAVIIGTAAIAVNKAKICCFKPSCYVGRHSFCYFNAP